MRCLVTGAAGFIGSHLCEELLHQGHEVVALDAFIPYYPRALKEDTLTIARQHPRFTFHECDLRTDDLGSIVQGVEVIFHLGAMPGLVASWTDFDLYMTCNVQATQRLLEAARQQGHIQQFIYASTSSVYGDYVVGPEDSPLNPVSPYGITKLAAEHLVRAYDSQFGVPTSILRYFSVYGPRQRPDMGYQIFMERILKGQEIIIFGDGTQTRANTYVTDIVNGTVLASQHFERGTIYNIGGQQEISLNDLIELLEEVIGIKAVLKPGPERKGEQSRTLADITSAHAKLGYEPAMPLVDGLAKQVEWNRQRLKI
jgi:nucleoside-diphosphate-sugar epimerase